MWTLLRWQLSDPCWLVVASSELQGDFNSFRLTAPYLALGLRSSKVKLSFLVVSAGMPWPTGPKLLGRVNQIACSQLHVVFCSSDPDDLTYDPQGGLGLWPGPIIDAHFRERGRQVATWSFLNLPCTRLEKGRLVQLVRDTRESEHGSTWGIGLDEDTGMECWSVLILED